MNGFLLVVYLFSDAKLINNYIQSPFLGIFRWNAGGKSVGGINLS